MNDPIVAIGVPLVVVTLSLLLISLALLMWRVSGAINAIHGGRLKEALRLLGDS